MSKEVAKTNADLSTIASGSNAFKKVDLKGIKFLNNLPVQWRANMEKSVGEFLMLDQKKGPTLDMRIINWRLEEGVQFSDQTGIEDVIQVLFIAPNNAISSITFRTHSISNFNRLITGILLNEDIVAQKIVTAKMVKKESNGNKYHIVEFEVKNNTLEGFEEIADFLVNVSPEAVDAFLELPRPEQE
jgi:hypothetical protein